MLRSLDVELYIEHGGKNKESVGHTARTRTNRHKFSGLESKKIDGRGVGADRTANRRED